MVKRVAEDSSRSEIGLGREQSNVPVPGESWRPGYLTLLPFHSPARVGMGASWGMGGGEGFGRWPCTGLALSCPFLSRPSQPHLKVVNDFNVHKLPEPQFPIMTCIVS